MNQIAMAANHNLMPVFYAGCTAGEIDSEGIHVCAGPQTRLKFLTDWINLHSSIDSPGDICIFAGYDMTPYVLGALFGVYLKERDDI